MTKKKEKRIGAEKKKKKTIETKIVSISVTKRRRIKK